MRLRILKKIILVLSSILLLSGCALLTCEPGKNEHYLAWEKRKVTLQKISAWNISGVFSVTYNNKRDIAHFIWDRTADNYLIDIYGPMHVKSIKIIGALQQVTLISSAQKPVFAKTPEELLSKNFGWKLPISNLRYWIIGLPVSTAITEQKFDELGRLNQFSQENWQITYADFQQFKQYDLPTTIELAQDQFKIKIKILDVKFPNEPNIKK